MIIRPGWDAPHVRCFPRTFCGWPCMLRKVGTVLGSPYDYVVARLAYANPMSRQKRTASTLFVNYFDNTLRTTNCSYRQTKGFCAHNKQSTSSRKLKQH